eukprot:g14196.t1
MPQLPHPHDAPQTDVNWAHAQQTENTDARGQVVVRAADLTGDVKWLPAIPQETMQALRVRLAAAYPETFGDLSTHVDFWREANDNDAVVDGDDLVVQGSANGTTVLQYAKTKVGGLAEWLALDEVKLSKYRDAASTWLHEKGADDYTAIFDQLRPFCDALGLKRLERRRINKYIETRLPWMPERCPEV